VKYRILGFDPASTRNLGWSVVILNKKPSVTAKIQDCECGTIVAPAFDSDERWRGLWPLFEGTEALIKATKPHIVIIEKTSNFKGGFITGQVSQCIGAILVCCGKYELCVESVFPTSVKKVVAGHGRADKNQVSESVEKWLKPFGKSVKSSSEHAIDATANIVYWLIKKQVLGD